MKELPNQAKMFIVAVMLTAGAVMVYAIGSHVQAETKEFVIVLAMALIAARMKVTLPGFESNMSMNLPFLLLAICELPMSEAIAVGALSTFVQTLPRSGQTVKPAQAVFNICNIVNAAAIASFASGRAIQGYTLNKPFLIAAAALAFFLADTIPVAGIVSMTTATKVIEAWSEIALMTFPYFVLSAGLACIVGMGFQAIGWIAGVTTLAIMVGVYRCFRYYFVHLKALASISEPREVAAMVGAD
jgi:hypothetical protein